MEKQKTPVLRAKMRINSVTHSINDEGKVESETVRLQAVYGREGTVNNQWSKWTPSAEFSITIGNPEAIGKLSKGGFYFVDFTPASIDA